MQDEIATAVVQALRMRLLSGALGRPKGGTDNLEAYQLYLRSLEAHRINTKASVEQAGSYLDQATKLDPSFSLGWKDLAWNFVAKSGTGHAAAG